MDSNINNILAADEKIIWEGVVNRKIMATFLIISWIITTVIANYFFKQEIIHFKLNGQAKEISGLVVGGVVCLIGLFLSLISYFADHVQAYAITQKRTIIKSGLIGTDFQSIAFDQIKSVLLDVGLMGKIFNAGSIKIDTGKTKTYSTRRGSRGSNRGIGILMGRSNMGTMQTKIVYDVLKHISNPYEVYKYFQEAQESRKETLFAGRADQEVVPEPFKS